jgi:hypothetical protein
VSCRRDCKKAPLAASSRFGVMEGLLQATDPPRAPSYPPPNDFARVELLRREPMPCSVGPAPPDYGEGG